MISVDNVTVEFGGRALSNDVTFNINEKDRITLMGKNGAGKSTLLKIIAGADKPTRGKISAPNEAVIAYLPQHLLTKDDATVFEETSKAFAEALSMKTELEALNHQLETRTDYESDAYMNIIERVSELSEKYYSLEEVNYDAEVEKTLLGLVISHDRAFLDNSTNRTIEITMGRIYDYKVNYSQYLQLRKERHEQ